MSIILKPDIHDYEFDDITRDKGRVVCPHCNKSSSQRYIEAVIDEGFIIILCFCCECQNHYKIEMERM